MAITAGTVYVASYHTNVGCYAFDVLLRRGGVDNPPLHALRNGVDGGERRLRLRRASCLPRQHLPVEQLLGGRGVQPSGDADHHHLVDQHHEHDARGSLPALWQQQDVGAVGVTGSGSYAAGTDTFTVQGSGADIIGAADAFRFVYRTMAGNGEIVARVTSLAAPQGWTKAGVMMRKTLTAGSEHATLVVSASNGSTFQRRSTSGGNTTNTDGPGSVPLWVRLVRSGNTFTAYRSTDGVAWHSSAPIRSP